MKITDPKGCGMKKIALIFSLLAVTASIRGTVAQQERRPLFVNEIIQWCGEEEAFRDLGNDCQGAAYAFNPDGSIRVVFNFMQSAGEFRGSCTDQLNIPDDVTGWAFIEVNGADGIVIPLEEVNGLVERTVPAYPDSLDGPVMVCELIVNP